MSRQPSSPAFLPRALRAGAWLLAPLVAHLAFSWIGFCPTDDGWLPAVARRIADGEVPHRDFIFVRPALSAILQVPLVWWAGDHVMALSRLWGWLTLAAIAWIWSWRVASDESPATRYALYLAAFAFGAHTFPVMAWHTIDGLLFGSLAVAAAGRGTPGGRRVGFLLVGTAALCRQNFGLFAPWLLLAVGGRPRDWLAAAGWSLVPVAAYFTVMAAAGAGADFLHQVAATGGGLLFHVGIQRFLGDPGYLVALVAGTGLGWVHHRSSSAALRWPVLLVIGSALAYSLSRGPWWFAETAFLFHGLVAGVTLIRLRHLASTDRLTAIGALGLAWTSAISLGYNTPALASGLLWLATWRLLRVPAETADTSGQPRLLLPATAGLAVAALAFARPLHPYMDRPVRELTHDAGTALAGAAGLRTNAVTHATLADLTGILRNLDATGRPYVVLTDCAAVWIRNPRRNPLPCEWPQETELGFDRELFGRVFRALRELPPEARIVTQRYLIADGTWRFAPIPPDSAYYFVQNWVRQNCQPAGETPFFTLYHPPRPPPLKAP
ncbi:MAG: DUF2029 domain-containing protein [Verrucomicrobia bacterium]|nr:DUF2029 domain-containing protein [Verrucomicrobiota bacterium]